MKKLKLIIAAFAILCIAATSEAQTPQAIKYQAVARNSTGDVIANQNVSFRISILQGNAQGSTVYEEVQPTTTNQFGLANLSIGQGSVVSGIFDSIKWGNDTYFVKVEFDPTGGSNYAVMGTSQLVSVPYSLYSAHAKVADNMPVFPLKGALQATNLEAPFNEPETGLLVYNTDSAGSAPYNVVPGYYYNAGTPQQPNWVILSVADNTKSHALPPCSTNQFGNCAGGTPTGTDNTGYGDAALSAITSGNGNTALGYDALTAVTTGFYNVAVGDRALASGTTLTCQANTAVGHSAMSSLIIGSGNTAVGQAAMVFSNNCNFNTGIGSDALADNTSGSGNTALGYSSLGGNTTGSDNTVSGGNALQANTTGSYNTANGSTALYSNISGSSITAIGNDALFKNTVDANTAVGDSAGASNTTGIGLTAVGYQAATATNTAQYITAVGYQALLGNDSTGINNTAVGGWALKSNTYGLDNSAFGFNSAHFNTSGEFNTAIGSAAMYYNTSGSYNTSTGYLSMEDNSGTGSSSSSTCDGAYSLFNNNASWNTGIGDSALYNTGSGNKNTAVGYEALITNTSGLENTALGYDADASANNLSNATAIGYGAIVCQSNSMLFGNGSVSAWGFGICPNSCSTNAIFAVNLPSFGSSIYMDNTGNWHSCSDRNKKENFKTVDEELLLKKIDNLPITQWNYKLDPTKTQHIGPMAQDFYRIFQVGNDSLTITTIDPAGIALAGIQALNRKLEAENAELKAQITQLAKNQVNDEREMAEIKASIGSINQAQASIK